MNTEKAIRAFIYARVSTKDQDPETQIEICKNYADRNDIDIKDIFSEKISGRKPRSRKQEKLTQLYALMERLRNREADVILITRIARLGRNFRELALILFELENLEIRLITTQQPIDTDTHIGKMFMYNLALIAEIEGEMISQRTKERMARLRAQGIKIGRPSKRDPDTMRGKQVRTRILQLLQEDPRPSLRKMGKPLGISPNTVLRIIREDPELQELYQNGTPPKQAVIQT